MPLSPSGLADLIASSEPITVLDLCLAEDFALDPRLIPTASRVDWQAVEGDGRVIVVCKKGLKISQGAAALLRTRGVEAMHLEGGAVAWAEAGHPMVPVADLPESGLWTMADGFGADVAEWLLSRFTTGQVILRVAPESMAAVADRWAAPTIEDPRALARRLGLATPAIEALLDAVLAAGDAPLSLPSLIRHSAPGAILDAAYRALRAPGEL
ncbi:rhodanese-like domain-containing protein [Aestuariibius sp. 2305UL40-4]